MVTDAGAFYDIHPGLVAGDKLVIGDRKRYHILVYHGNTRSFVPSKDAYYFFDKKLLYKKHIPLAVKFAQKLGNLLDFFWGNFKRSFSISR